MMNSEDLVRMIVNGYSNELKALMSLGVGWIRNNNENALTAGDIFLEGNIITIHTGGIKLVINYNGSISIEENGKPATMIDTIAALKLFATMMTTIKLKSFRISSGIYSRAATITITPDVEDSIAVVFNAILEGVEEDEDTTK